MSADRMPLVEAIDWLLIHVFRMGTTTRSAAVEFGPPPGARYARQLAAYSDLELIARERDDILREIRAKETTMDTTTPRGTAARITERRAAEAVERREMEDRVLAAESALDPDDGSLSAEIIRQTAESIRDHREAVAR